MSTTDSGAPNCIPLFLLKTKSTPNDGYEERFSIPAENARFAPTFVPVLEHQLMEEGLDIVRTLLAEKQIGKGQNKKYGGMIFTSQRAVEAFTKLVEEGKGQKDWPYLQDVPIYTVGPATSRALKSIPQSPPLQIFGADMGNGEALSHYMLDHYIEWYKDYDVKPSLLFLVGDQRRDIIPKTLMNPELASDKRIQVDELVVYGTGVMHSFEQDFSQQLAETATLPLRWVVVFSPTGCQAMLRALHMLNEQTGKVKEYRNSAAAKTYIATIGPTTRDYLRTEFGYEPDVCAAKPSPEGIEAGISAFMNARNV